MALKIFSIEYEQLKQQSNSQKYPSDQVVFIDSIYRVFHHGERQHGDTHRFASSEDPEDFMSMVCAIIVLYY